MTARRSVRGLVALLALGLLAAACVGGDPPGPRELADADDPQADDSTFDAIVIPSLPIRLVGEIDTVAPTDTGDYFKLPANPAEMVISIDATDCTDDNATSAPFVRIEEGTTLAVGHVVCGQSGTVTVPAGEWYVLVAWGNVPGENTASYRIEVDTSPA